MRMIPIRPSTFDRDLHMYVYHGCAREPRLSRRRERERRNRALESAEEEARRARRRVRDRALRAAQSTAQREAVQRRRERGFGAEFTYVRTYVHVHIRLYGRICPARSNVHKLAQARPTMPAFL